MIYSDNIAFLCTESFYERLFSVLEEGSSLSNEPILQLFQQARIEISILDVLAAPPILLRWTDYRRWRAMGGNDLVNVIRNTAKDDDSPWAVMFGLPSGRSFVCGGGEIGGRFATYALVEDAITFSHHPRPPRG